tara:strand:- start:191 stop:949 length:759 start_codon:yes stop_codon:yes gene_type:complete
MKKYNIKNYKIYKEDLKYAIQRIPKKSDFTLYTRKELKVLFLPLVENVARKFSTAHTASGVLSILDLIQIGSAGLSHAVERLQMDTLMESLDQEKTIKSFLSKRIRGAIRRGIDTNRADMRIPEHKLNEIRRNSKNREMVMMFFNSIFLSIDSAPYNNDSMIYQIPDKSEPYNTGLLNSYLMGLLKKHLDDREYEVLRLSYGLDCEKHSAKQIAEKLNIVGASDYVRVSELKKSAVQKLIDNVDHSQVLDYL